MGREQVLAFGDIAMHKDDEEDNLYFLAGKRMYVIGATSGDYPPLGWRRPGFLVGKRISEVGEAERPVTAAHFLNEMGGVWAHPMKVLEGIYYSLSRDDGEWWDLRNSYRFENHLSHVDFYFQRSDLAVHRQDFVVEDQPALFSSLSVSNRSTEPARLRLRLQVETNLMPSWFSGWRDGEDLLEPLDNAVWVTDSEWQKRWAVVFGSALAPAHRELVTKAGEKRGHATLIYDLSLAAKGEQEITFLYVAEGFMGLQAAKARFQRLLSHRDEALAEKQRYYESAVLGGVRLFASDREAEQAFVNAKANLVQLQTDLTPYLGKYYFAGLPEYVQLFGTDTAYSVAGATAIGQAEWARESLRQLARFAQRQCGRVPHEVTTNGRVFHPGNTQETPQFAIAAWDYFRWTGDLKFLADVYPLCEEGVLDYILVHWDADLDYYPDGNGMVERAGMGPEKLDSIVYFCKAVYCLSAMAGALGREDERERHLQLARALRVAINQDFWMPDQSMFADSLADNHAKELAGHWTVVTPIEAGVADRDKAAQSLARIEREWVNEYGMVHTRLTEELVWTLPTGLLALAAFAYDRTELGWRMLANIARTTAVGSLGTYKELIPEGLCFMQLWSPAIFLQGVIEGLFGVVPRADLNRVEVFPKLPAGWEYARLEGLRIGDHELDLLHDRRDGRETVAVAHRGALSLDCRLHVRVGPGARLLTTSGRELPIERDRRAQGVACVDVRLAPGERAEVTMRGDQVVVAARTMLGAAAGSAG